MQRDLDDAEAIRASDRDDKVVIDQLRKDSAEKLVAAKANRRQARNALKAAENAAAQVELAQKEIARLEQKILELDRKMNEVASEAELATEFGGARGVRPPTSSKQATKYAEIEKQRAEALESLKGRTDDLTRSLADQARSMTPGPEGKVRALQNAEELGKTYDVLAPKKGEPIDVTTGKPIEGTWNPTTSCRVPKLQVIRALPRSTRPGARPCSGEFQKTSSRSRRSSTDPRSTRRCRSG